MGLTIKIDGDETILSPDNPKEAGVGFVISNKEMGIAFLQWLRCVDKNEQMRIFAAIVLEYQVAAHINTKSEEDHLADSNMTHTEGLVHQIIKAVVKMSVIDETGIYVSVDAIERHLRDDCHLLLPKWVVYTVLKTMEECVPGSCREMEYGYFTVTKHFNR